MRTSSARKHGRRAASIARPLCAITALAVAACAGASTGSRAAVEVRPPLRAGSPPGSSSYERQWGNVCSPGGRAPARPERHRAQVEQLEGPQISAALLVIPEGKDAFRTDVLSNAPAEVATALDARWRAHAAGAARCFGDATEGFETFPIVDGVIAPIAPDASARKQCVHRVVTTAFAGLSLSGAEIVAVLHGSEAQRAEKMDRDARSKPVQGSLSKAHIKQVIDAGLAAIKSCYDQALAVWPTLAGQLTARIIIASDGTVDTSEITSSELRNPAVECCISSHMATLVFDHPEGGGIVVVSYPFIFSAAK